MQLSVVILNYNVRYFLELCLLSVSKAIEGIDAEIIVVDNNSPDDSCKMVREKFPQIHLIENKENSGFPKGNNIGVDLAKGEIICILNPDTVVTENSFKELLTYFQTLKNPGIVGCKLIDGKGNFLPESKRGTPTPWVAFTKVLGLYKIAPSLFGKYYASHIKENQNGEIDILVGAFMMMKRQDYLEVGGFDEDCFMYSDDIDLSYSILKKGKKNHYFPEVISVHFKGESTVKDGLYMQRFRDAMNFFYKKHYNPSVVFDKVMKLGTWWFSLRKKKSTKTVEPVSEYVLISPDNNKEHEIRKVLNKPIRQIDDLSKIQLQEYQNNTQFIFDVKAISFHEILTFMDQFHSQRFTFRFLMNDYIIGSDSSLDRGEVQLLNKSKTFELR